MGSIRITVAAAVVGLVVGLAGCAAHETGDGAMSEGRVTGIGGVFFKSKDPKALGAWHRDALGIEMDKDGYMSFRWREHEPPHRDAYTAWGPFPEDTDYFDPTNAEFMVNFRVDDLDALLEKLRAKGVWIDEKREEYEYGKFAWIRDPEGNRIELWEPAPGYTFPEE